MIIRALCVLEEPAVCAFMLALSEHDRYRRFCRPMTDAAIRAYLCAIDWNQTLILGAFDRDARLIGMLELCDAGRCAEIAVAIAPEHREQGVARALLQRALIDATGLGKERVVFTCLTENLPMRRLARSAGFVATNASSATESEVAMDEPVPGEAPHAGVHKLVGNISYATAPRSRSRTDVARQLSRTPELRNGHRAWRPITTDPLQNQLGTGYRRPSATLRAGKKPHGTLPAPAICSSAHAGAAGIRSGVPREQVVRSQMGAGEHDD